MKKHSSKNDEEEKKLAAFRCVIIATIIELVTILSFVSIVFEKIFK